MFAKGRTPRAWRYVLAATGGVAAAVAAIRLNEPGPPPPDSRFINFDAQSMDHAALESGWSEFEHDGKGETWTWCVATSCSLVVQAHGKRDRVLKLRAWAFRFPDAPPQIVTMFVNGTEVSKFNVGDPSVWEIPVGKQTWKEGKNALRFDFAYARSPAHELPGASDDHRQLSVAFDWLEVIAR